MKTKKPSLLAKLIAVLLVVVVTTGFATSAAAKDISFNRGSMDDSVIFEKDKNVMDLTTYHPSRITAGSKPTQSYDNSTDKGTQSLIMEGQKTQVSVVYLPAFHVESGEENIKVIFEDSEHHVVEAEIGDMKKKYVIFENAGVYSIKVQNTGNRSVKILYK